MVAAVTVGTVGAVAGDGVARAAGGGAAAMTAVERGPNRVVSAGGEVGPDEEAKAKRAAKVFEAAGDDGRSEWRADWLCWGSVWSKLRRGGCESDRRPERRAERQLRAD